MGTNPPAPPAAGASRAMHYLHVIAYDDLNSSQLDCELHALEAAWRQDARYRGLGSFALFVRDYGPPILWATLRLKHSAYLAELAAHHDHVALSHGSSEAAQEWMAWGALYANTPEQNTQLPYRGYDHENTHDHTSV